MDRQSFEKQKAAFEQRKLELEGRKIGTSSRELGPPRRLPAVAKAVVAGLLAIVLFLPRLISRHEVDAVPAAPVAQISTAKDAPDLENQDNWATADMDYDKLVPALNRFYHDCGRCPSTQEGLRALSVAPIGLGSVWSGPYLKQPLVNDPWGNPYVYRAIGHDAYSLRVEDGSPMVHTFSPRSD